jgi:hypothetical protein
MPAASTTLAANAERVVESFNAIPDERQHNQHDERDD